MLEIRNLFKFENQNIILNNINLKLNKGDILAIVGPTGSGKTCLLKCLLKLTKYDQGEIYFNENKVLNKDDMGYLPTEIKLYKKSKIKSLIEYNDTFYENDTLTKALDLVKVLNLDGEKKVEDLVFSELKKLGLVLTLMHEPKIIVLDEPTRGMNQKDKDKIFNILNNEKKKGNIIIIASSNLNDIRGISNKIAFMKNGSILDIGYSHKLNTKNYYNIRIKGKNIKKVNFDLKKMKIKKISNDYIECVLCDKINNFITLISNLEIEYLYIEEPPLEDLINYFYNRKD